MSSTDAKLVPIKFKPGFHKESTEYSEEGNWVDGDHVRFRQGKPENKRGYSKLIDTSLVGTSRDLFAWTNTETQRLLATGTEQRLYVYYNDVVHDITPIRTTVSVSAPTSSSFSTSVGSSLILVSINSHGADTDDWITFSNVSINGFGATSHDFASTTYGGPLFQVVNVIDTNKFYISVTSVATSTETNMGTGTVKFYIANEQTTNIQGLGYGAGYYSGAQGYGQAASSSNITFLANQWSMDAWGEDLLAVRRGGPLFFWDSDASTTPIRAEIVVSAPDNIRSIVISPNDRHVIALGTKEYGTGIYNPMLVRWSNRESYTEWTPSISSTAGEVQLIDGTEIRGGVRARNVIHVWTDQALYGMQYIGPPFIYGITQLGTNCGLVAPHAAIAVDGISYWMCATNFYRFAGRVERLDCTVRKYVFDGLVGTQKDKVYAGFSTEFNEIIWLYPRDGALEPNAYVIYNILEDTWAYGSSFYTTFRDRQIFGSTITTGANTSINYFWLNEPKNIFTGDGEAISSYIESAPFDIGEGDDVVFVDKLVPDFTLSGGTIDVYIKTKKYPNSTEEITKGPYNITTLTNKVNFRSRGRQMKFRLESEDSGVSWRMGTNRLAIKPDGKR